MSARRHRIRGRRHTHRRRARDETGERGVVDTSRSRRTLRECSAEKRRRHRRTTAGCPRKRNGHARLGTDPACGCGRSIFMPRAIDVWIVEHLVDPVDRTARDPRALEPREPHAIAFASASPRRSAAPSVSRWRTRVGVRGEARIGRPLRHAGDVAELRGTGRRCRRRRIRCPSAHANT